LQFGLLTARALANPREASSRSILRSWYRYSQPIYHFQDGEGFGRQVERQAISARWLLMRSEFGTETTTPRALNYAILAYHLNQLLSIH
jgi:hypothetical protein